MRRKLTKERILVDVGGLVKLNSLKRNRMRSTGSIQMSRTQAALMSVSKRIFAVSLSPENCVTLERSITSCSEDNKKTKIAEKKIAISLSRKKYLTQERSNNFPSDDTRRAKIADKKMKQHKFATSLPRKNSVTEEHSIDHSPDDKRETKIVEKMNKLPQKNPVTLEHVNHYSDKETKTKKLAERKISELSNTTKVIRKRRHSTTPAPRLKEVAIQPRLRHAKSLTEIPNTEIVDGLFTTTLCSTEL